jgi:VCBS repeat-containing protein
LDLRRQQCRSAVSQSGGLGTYSIDADGHWTYAVNNAAVQFLNTGETATDNFVVTSLDGTAQETVAVTITGAMPGPYVVHETLPFTTEVLQGHAGAADIFAINYYADVQAFDDMIVGFEFDKDLIAFVNAPAGTVIYGGNFSEPARIHGFNYDAAADFASVGVTTSPTIADQAIVIVQQPAFLSHTVLLADVRPIETALPTVQAYTNDPFLI